MDPRLDGIVDGLFERLVPCHRLEEGDSHFGRLKRRDTDSGVQGSDNWDCERIHLSLGFSGPYRNRSDYFTLSRLDEGEVGERVASWLRSSAREGNFPKPPSSSCLSLIESTAE